MTTKFANPIYPINVLNQQQFDTDFLITKSEGNTNLTNSNGGGDSSGVDHFFNQKSPYNYPPMIICADTKRNNINVDIVQKFTDIIYDDCNNRFNIKNMRDSAGVLQAGYSANIDLDSHLKNINFYTDKCFYDNWKLNPKSAEPACNGIKRNATILVPDYTPVGRHYEDTIGNCNKGAPCNNTPPTDINCETDVKNRYDFTHNKFVEKTCIVAGDRVGFKLAPAPTVYNLDKYPNVKRERELLETINKGVTYDYYKFFDENKCIAYPSERLFNNNTSRKSTPNHHNMQNIQPQYLK